MRAPPPPPHSEEPVHGDKLNKWNCPVRRPEMHRNRAKRNETKTWFPSLVRSETFEFSLQLLEFIFSWSSKRATRPKHQLQSINDIIVYCFHIFKIDVQLSRILRFALHLYCNWDGYSHRISVHTTLRRKGSH